MLKAKQKFVNNQKYRQLYNQKCKAWRNQPTFNRQRNDVFCIVLFVAITVMFLGVGLYYIITVTPNPYTTKTQFDIIIQQFLENKWLILISYFSTTLLNILYIYLLNVYPKCVIYTLMIATLAIFPVFNLTVKFQQTWWITLSVQGVTLLIYLIIVACYRKQITIGIILIKIATRFMMERKIVFAAIFIKIAMISVFGAFWYYSSTMIQAQLENYQIIGQDTSLQRAFLLLWNALFIYYELLIYYLMVFTFSVMFALWYYQVDQSKSLSIAWKWIFKSAFGSISFAALIITVTKLICIIFDTQKEQKCNCVSKVCLKMINFCFARASSILEFLNHYSIVCMAVTGQYFIDSAKTAIGVVGQQFAIISMFEKFIIFWGTFFSVLTPLIGTYFISGVSISETKILPFLNLNSSVLLIFMLSECLGCVIMFYNMDKRFKELGYSTHRMSEQIRIALQEDCYDIIKDNMNKYVLLHA